MCVVSELKEMSISAFKVIDSSVGKKLGWVKGWRDGSLVHIREGRGEGKRGLR